MATRAETEAAAFQIHCELGTTITAARIAAMKALTAAEQARWQPIESALREPWKRLDLWVCHSISGGRLAQSGYWNDGWHDNGGNKLDFSFEEIEDGEPDRMITSRVTHCRPLPSPPSDERNT